MLVLHKVVFSNKNFDLSKKKKRKKKEIAKKTKGKYNMPLLVCHPF